MDEMVLAFTAASMNLCCAVAFSEVLTVVLSEPERDLGPSIGVHLRLPKILALHSEYSQEKATNKKERREYHSFSQVWYMREVTDGKNE